MGSFQLRSKCLRLSEGLDVSSELDRISKLPDDVLVKILDELPLDEAIATTFLSKRWNGLWMHKRRIEIGYEWLKKTGKKVLPSLQLIFCRSVLNPIRSVSLSFRFDNSMWDKVQCLISSASLKKVEELFVDFDDINDNRLRRSRRYPRVPIPEFKVSSFVTLGLRSLLLETLPSSGYKALEQLFLENVLLYGDSVSSITKNCPSLTLLSLTHCNQSDNLRIIISTDSNKLHLVINEICVNPSSWIHINVMSGVKSIEFVSALPRKKYFIEGILHCSDSATFQLDQMFRLCNRFYRLGFRGNYAENFVKLVGELKMAKVLTLDSWSIQVLAVEIKMLSRPPTFNATDLLIQSALTKWELVGLSYLLLGCCKLKRLVIDLAAGLEVNLKRLEKMKISGPVVKSESIFQGLELVEFRNLYGVYTWKGDDFHVLPFFNGFEYASVLLWNLKMHANHLKKIVFRTRRQVFETSDFQRFGDPEPCGMKFKYLRMPHCETFRVTDT